MSVRERMIAAAYAAPKAAGVLAVDVEIIAQACADVAMEDNAKLLDMYKTRGAEIEATRSQLENALDASKEGGWMARALDAERELAQLKKEADVHSEWRKAANRRVRELEAQLADAAASGMTKREHFAASALQGLLSGMDVASAGAEDAAHDCKITSEWAVTCADALLAALEAKQ